MELVKNGIANEEPKSHLVAVVVYDVLADGGGYFGIQIEKAYQALNRRALEGGYVIVSCVTTCTRVGESSCAYTIVVQVVLKDDLLRLQREQQFSVMPPRGRG